MLWKIRIVFSITNVIYNVFRPIWLFFHKKPPSIPPITRSIYMLSATKLAKKIREGEITSSEVVQEYIMRIKEVNSFINAVVDERFADAMIEAKNYDEQLKEGKFDINTLEKEKPLYGVPITIKECCAVKGCSHTGCTLPRKGIKADYDAAIVELLRNAGAIPLCVTNTPEMCSGFDSTNLLYGHTCNPYDTRYSAGGSSGGEGALLGAGGSVIGIGSDLAGSIRIPAFLNGVFGHKPTPGIIPSNGHFPFTEDKYFHKFMTFGPMTRYAEDLGLLMKVMTSKCNHDLRLDVPVDLKQIKIYYRQSLDKTFGVLSMSQEIENCVLKAANYFARYNVRAEKLPIEWPVTITDIVLTGFLNIKEPPQVLLDASNPKHHKNINVEMMKALFGLSEHTKQLLFFNIPLATHFPFTESEISHYTKHAEEIRQKLLDLLGDNGVLIYPTFRKQFLSQFVLCEMMSVANCGIFNIFGFPAVHVPMGLNLHEKMPIGVQVIAAPYQDRLCLAVAKELEMAFGGWIPPSVAISD
ncbi:Fatty-acid amide hydrolase 2 [Trachymyrmex septentrionalis]|uniref:Fatty-acid amide hydrolase 2 n=1 Tax=Trachymyrmex septentrionalis TaxID=34720 RepID=A0A195FEN1_9HYME|nr:PREDICTED: fatty-acid amide hydrolase 2-like [Trachymyrmex septentrionalis]XP_018343018.1 PREDICTED: fatty-acid amide hydrolase 2-like [Trachymyrmex septentrionalis]XP_018343019.1 PREDICTED: fatty-acid amide hydrolase 2-like [Trachymyrmex septentrionalis]KYN38836.1 Fatty-acid amide hydrolase 2 [Trachymyrmex septentrionalis]